MEINFVNNPAETRDWFDTATITIAAVGVIVTALATFAAFRAGYWAKRAYVAQEKQFIASRRQLRLAYKQQKIALNQEARQLEILDRDRRSLGPYFEVGPFVSFRTMNIKGFGGRLVQNEHPLIFSENIGGSLLNIVRDRQNLRKPLFISIFNRNSMVKLRGWKCDTSDPDELDEIEMYKVENIDSLPDEHPLIEHGFILSLQGKLPWRVSFNITFETHAGMIDTHAYEITLPRRGGCIARACLNRIAPGGVPNPDLEHILEGDDF